MEPLGLLLLRFVGDMALIEEEGGEVESTGWSSNGDAISF